MGSAFDQFEQGRSSRRRAFEALEPHDLDVIAVLSAAGEPLHRSKLAEMSAVAGLKTADDKRAINPGYLKSCVGRWLEMGLIGLVAPNQHAYLCAEDVAHWALVRAVETGSFAAVTRGVQTVAPADRYYYSFDHSRFFRDARLDLYASTTDGVDARVAKRLDQLSHFGGHEVQRYPLLKLFGVFAPHEALALLPPTMSRLYAEEATELGLRSLVGLGAAGLELCHAHAKEQPSIARGLALLEAFRGDTGALAQLATRCADEEVLIAKMLSALVSEEIESAREQAMLLVEASRGPRGRRKPRVAGFAGVLATLLLLTSRTRAHRLSAQALLPATKGTSSLPSPHGLFLRAFDDFVQNPASASFEALSETRYYVAPEGWPEALLRLLIGRYMGRKRDEKGALAALLGQARQSAVLGGYAWLATELQSVLSRPAQAGRAKGVLVTLYEQRSAWEHTLDALADFAKREGARGAAERAKDNAQRIRWSLRYEGPPAAGADDAAQRLAGAVDEDGSFDSYFDDLAPRIAGRGGASWRRTGAIKVEARQQRYRKGKWTKGRIVSLSLLREETSAGRLPEEDARVCTHIVAAQGPGGPFELDEQVGLALVGHPRVVWNDEERPVEVIRAEPTLVVREQGPELSLAMRPSSLARCPDAPIIYEREGDQLLVYALTDTHREIARVIGAGVSLPSDSRGRLERQLGELAGIIPLQSEVAVRGGAAEAIEGDARPVLQLRRGSPGLIMRLRAFPLGLDGPDFPPGRGPRTVVAHLDGKARRARRDLEAEASRVDELLSSTPELAEIDREGDETAVADIITCYEILTAISGLPEEALQLIWPEGEALSVAGERDVRDMRVGFRRAGDWLAASGALEVEEGLVLEMAEILERFAARKGRFIKLADGRILALTDRLRRRIEALDALGQTRRKKLEMSPLALFSIESWIEDSETVRLDRGVKEQLDRLREAQSIDPQVPVTLQASLRDYQRDGYRWLCRLAHWGAGACLADDMGLGKTLQALALILHRAAEGPALVVAPTSVCHGWIDHARRFCPTLRALRFGEGDREAMLDSLGPNDLLVVSYGLLVQAGERLGKCDFAVAVLDEAQAIKNARTKRAKAARGIRAKCRVVTTGTPVENHLGEIWSQMAFLNPGLLGTPTAFQERYAKPIQRHGDKRAADRLRRLLRPFILRRTKAQVLDELPPKTEILLPIEPDPDHAALYERLRAEAQERMERAESSPEERMRLLGDLMRLRRAACHPRLVLPESRLSSAKLEALIELLDELRDEGHRVLVFSQFVDHLSLVRERLDAANWRYQYLDGRTPTKRRQRAVDAFQRGEGEVFLISLRAGGFGLNLTAADYVVHLDPWWNPAVEDQASDRAHRIGQTRPVTIYKLVSEGTIEERILELHGDKRELAAELLAGTDTATSLGIEQLRELLREA